MATTSIRQFYLIPQTFCRAEKLQTLTEMLAVGLRAYELILSRKLPQKQDSVKKLTYTIKLSRTVVYCSKIKTFSQQSVRNVEIQLSFILQLAIYLFVNITSKT